MDYVGYAGLFTAGMGTGIIIAISRMYKAMVRERRYADHLRMVLDATEYRYTQLSADLTRLKNKVRSFEAASGQVTEGT